MSGGYTTVGLVPIRTFRVCPACLHPVHVNLGLPIIDDNGELTVDESPLAQALQLHLRFGCPNVRRVSGG